MLILRNQPATLTVTVRDEAGDPTNLEATATLAITDANGDSISTGAVSSPGTGIYTSVLPPQADLAELVAVWSGDLSGTAIEITQHHEVVGNLLFTEADARAAKTSGGQTPLSSESSYDDDALKAVRELITEQFEERTGRAWTRRYCRMELAGTGTRRIALDGHARDSNGTRSGGPGHRKNIAKVISATIGGSAVDLSKLVIDGHHLLLTEGTWTAATVASPLNVVVEYEYGDDPVSAEAKEHAIRTALATLVHGDISDYVEIRTTTEATERYGTDGIVWPPKVLDWLNRTPVVVLG